MSGKQKIAPLESKKISHVNLASPASQTKADKVEAYLENELNKNLISVSKEDGTFEYYTEQGEFVGVYTPGTGVVEFRKNGGNAAVGIKEISSKVDGYEDHKMQMSHAPMKKKPDEYSKCDPSKKCSAPTNEQTKNAAKKFSEETPIEDKNAKGEIEIAQTNEPPTSYPTDVKPSVPSSELRPVPPKVEVLGQKPAQNSIDIGQSMSHEVLCVVQPETGGVLKTETPAKAYKGAPVKFEPDCERECLPLDEDPMLREQYLREGRARPNVEGGPQNTAVVLKAGKNSESVVNENGKIAAVEPKAKEPGKPVNMERPAAGRKNRHKKPLAHKDHAHKGALISFGSEHLGESISVVGNFIGWPYILPRAQAVLTMLSRTEKPNAHVEAKGKNEQSDEHREGGNGRGRDERQDNEENIEGSAG